MTDKPLTDAELEAMLRGAVAALVAEVRRLRAERDELRSLHVQHMKDAQAEEIGVVRHERDELRAERGEMQARIDTLLAQHAADQERIAELEGINLYHQRSHERHVARIARVAELEAEASEYVARIADLEAQHAADLVWKEELTALVGRRSERIAELEESLKVSVDVSLKAAVARQARIDELEAEVERLRRYERMQDAISQIIANGDVP